MEKEVNMLIDQGGNFVVTLAVCDSRGNSLDLTGATVASQMKPSYRSPTYYTFTPTIVDATNGIITLSMTSSYTATIPAGRYYYDAFYTLGSNKVKMMKGIVTIEPSVTP